MGPNTLPSTELVTQTLKEMGAEPLPGYRLLAPLGRGGFGEVWKCEAPGGLLKAIKFVKGVSGGTNLSADVPRDSAQLEFRAIQRIKAVRHPFLLSLERVEVLAGELVLVMELADQNLVDRFAECCAAGQPGIARDELLAYLTEAAEALDVLNLQHGLQHLDVKPANLFIVGHHLKVADFGLVNTLEERPGDGPRKDLGGLTPHYVAPEMLQGKVSRQSDQYSLAVVYQELLTGAHPFPGDDPQQVMVAHLRSDPDLSALPERDRPVVARALAKDPARRFPSCLDFVQELVFADSVTSTPAPRFRRPQAPLLPPAQSNSTVAIKRPKVPPPVALVAAASPPTPPAAPPLVPDTDRQVRPDTNTALTLPGYYLLAQLSHGPFGELYRARDAVGRERQVRYLPYGGGEAELDPRLLARLGALRHRALPALEVERIVNGRVVLITDLAERTLDERFRECLAEGAKGVPRAELLHALGAAAEALDDLRRRERLQHLGLSPQAVLLDSGGGVRVGDFGLAQLLWLPRWRKATHWNPRYAAPELLKGSVNPACDAYSLALIFAELLTGFHPFHHRLRSRTAAATASARPDLDWLPAPDRPALARALHPDPRERFQNCTELVEALTATVSTWTFANHEPADQLPFVQPLANLFGGGERLATTPSIHCVVTQVVLTESSAETIRVANKLPYLQRSDRELEARFPIRQLPGLTRLKMDAFREKWQARLVSQTDGAFVFRLQESASFWQRCFGQQAGLEVRLELRSPPNGRSHTSEAVATVRPFGGDEHLTERKLQEVGPLVLVSLRDELQNTPEQRDQVRWPCSAAVDLYPLLPDGGVAGVLEGKGVDISFAGIAFQTATRPAPGMAYLHLKTFPELATSVFLVRILRVAPDDAGYRCGAAFATAGAAELDSTGN